MRRLSLALLVVLGCGDPAADADARAEATAYPLEWEAGEAIAAITVERVTEDPATLRDPSCAVSVELAEATAAGAIPFGDEEGACILTSAPIDLRSQSSFAPLCGGNLALRVGGASQTINVCSGTISPTVSAARRRASRWCASVGRLATWMASRCASAAARRRPTGSYPERPRRGPIFGRSSQPSSSSSLRSRSSLWRLAGPGSIRVPAMPTLSRCITASCCRSLYAAWLASPISLA